MKRNRYMEDCAKVVLIYQEVELSDREWRIILTVITVDIRQIRLKIQEAELILSKERN